MGVIASPLPFVSCDVSSAFSDVSVHEKQELFFAMIVRGLIILGKRPVAVHLLVGGSSNEILWLASPALKLDHKDSSARVVNFAWGRSGAR